MEFTSHVMSIEKSEFCDVFLTPKVPLDFISDLLSAFWDPQAVY